MRAVSKAKDEPNPLRLDYFSTVPYRLGAAAGPKKAIKFRVVLCDPEKAKHFPATAAGPENLIGNIAATINSVNEVCYHFQIQVAGPKDKVEDATTRWLGGYATVGTLRIFHSDNPAGDLAERKEFCEHLSFNPWRTLPVRRPLGRINRARFTTYLMSSAYRHQENRKDQQEPGLDSW